jgi:DNA helicase-2/ATP-dependent DNA helicase PcrA
MSTFRDHLQIIVHSSPPPIERLWEMAGFTPNNAQRQAILHVDGPLYLTAGPGSGKTRVLLWRTLNLIVYHGFQPGEIFLSTFTEKAALQLTDGLRALLGMVTNLTGQPFDLSQIYIGTVHSLCQRMLSDRRRFFEDRHRQRAPSLLDDLGQYFHLYDSSVWEKVTRFAGLEPESAAARVNNLIEGKDSPSRHRAIQNLRPLFNRFSEEMLDATQTRARLNALQWGERFTSADVDLLLRLYEGYLLTLRESRQTDFALLQREAFEVLQRFADAGRVFRHVIVDEYQDTNYIQERIFFRLAEGTGNICVVGDDDQALYRFRGATVENFVQFPARCQTYLGKTPHRIALDTNYRSRQRIVDFYTRFMTGIPWKSEDGKTTYRVDKAIQAHRRDRHPAVVASAAAEPEAACREIAHFVRRLLDEGKVENPNQIAFLYPSLKSEQVKRMKAALEAEGLSVYAPRAGRFLEVEEAMDMLGVFLAIFGRPKIEGMGQDLYDFEDYLTQLNARAADLQAADPLLKQFVQDRRAEIQRAVSDYAILLKAVERSRWKTAQAYDPAAMKRPLVSAPGLSKSGQRLIGSVYLDRIAQMRAREGRPLSLEYVLRRATSLDWNVLDLFYQLTGFEHFKRMFDQAERNGDEGPVANLGLLTQYLQRFVDERVNVITAPLLQEHKFSAIFFGSYLFALFRLGESELEDREDPFPRGRIPFLTIHQAKGLEFPVVVLGNLDRRDHGIPVVEQIVRPLLTRPVNEPLERIHNFDTMRMFYVALSRAKELLILAHFAGRGQRMYEAFRTLLKAPELPRLAGFDLTTLPPSTARDENLPKMYSFTSDYLLYQKCPRQYMIFRKFGFVPSRSQTMFFGSLVHRTLEDLHHELIRRRRMTGDGRPEKTDDQRPATDGQPSTVNGQ